MSPLHITTQAIDWDGIWGDTVGSVINFLPNLLIFLVVLLIGWLVAKAVSKGLEMLLDRVGFNRMLSRSGAERTLQAAQIDVGSLISKLVYYFILLIALQLALTAFGPANPVSQIVDDIVSWLPNAFVAIVIVIIAAAVANAVRDILEATLGGLSYGPLLAKIVAWSIVALGVIAALNQVGIGLSVTLPVLIAVLATIGGILVVGVGGGLVGPMRARWEDWLDTLESDAKRAKETAPAAGGSHAAQPTSPQPTTPQPTTPPPSTPPPSSPPRSAR
jgi:hypothetical protein